MLASFHKVLCPYNSSELEGQHTDQPLQLHTALDSYTHEIGLCSHLLSSASQEAGRGS